GIRDFHVTGVQTCALPISYARRLPCARGGASAAHPHRRLEPADVAGARPAGRRTARAGRGGRMSAAAFLPWQHETARAWLAGREIGRASCRERGEDAGGGG